MRFWLAVVAACAAFGQTAGTPLSFEVASVKPASKPIATKDEYSEGYNAGMRAALADMGLRVVGNRVTATDNTLKSLIRIAYDLKDHQVIGPSWLATEKYEVAAIMPAGSTRDQAPLMLRTLLAQRFHLEFHREMRKTAAYALVIAKGGPKVTAVPGPEARNLGGSLRGRVHLQSATIATFVDRLMRTLEKPVVNETGLAGLYNFDLTFAADVTQSSEEAPPGLSDALQQQLGLKLDKRELQIEVLVVDRADKVPAQN